MNGLLDPTGNPDNYTPVLKFRCTNPACGITASAPYSPGKCYECGSDFECLSPAIHVYEPPEDVGLPRTHWWNEHPWPKDFLAAFPERFEGMGEDDGD